MNRRTFFKRIAATCAGVAAVVVAPAVLVVGEKKPLPFKPNPVQQKFMNQPLPSEVLTIIRRPSGWIIIPNENP